MNEAHVDLGTTEKRLTIRLNGSKPTFLLRSDRISAALVGPIDPLLEDLIEIAAVVFAADSSVPRGGPTRSDMGEGWHRTFAYTIPVRDPAFWSQPRVNEALSNVVTFLTDDIVDFKFAPHQEARAQQDFLQFDPDSNAFAADEVILFSGGLDSFAGALEFLSTRAGRVALVSHRSSQKVTKRQHQLGKYLARRFPGRVLHIQVAAHRIGREARESTQRSRSFLFAALGQTVARMLGAKRMSFYENGIVSQNLPISPQVVGTMATRTTHPLALRMLNELMDLIVGQSIPISNPYQWLTKTEVVARIAKHGGSGQIRVAVSCTSVREQGTLHTHCGTCSQCLDRRFALLAADLAAEDPAEMYGTEVILGARDSDRSKTMALDWTRHALRLTSLNEVSLMSAFGQEIMRIARGYPAHERQEAITRTLDMQRRHGQFVTDVLERSIRDLAGYLARLDLSETSLLRLHLADGSMNEPTRAPDRRLEARPHPSALFDRPNAPDIVFDPKRPLEIIFSHEGNVAILDVQGLGTVKGAPASVAHQLKPTFDADRAAGLSRENHRYISQGELARQMELTKPAVTQNVKRCRQTLHSYYQALVGSAPDAHMVIQSRKASGYRLDPDIRPIAAGKTALIKERRK
jgi:7-cyano-7-deazaguanine synthase in queuosine biosynthesis